MEGIKDLVRRSFKNEPGAHISTITYTCFFIENFSNLESLVYGLGTKASAVADRSLA